MQCTALAGATEQRLLFVTPRGENCVRVLSLRAAAAAGGALEADQLRRLSGCDCSRLLVFGDCLLGGLWNADTDAHAVHAWRVAAAGARSERLGSVYADGVDINCWAVIRARLVLYDTNREQLIELECAPLASSSFFKSYFGLRFEYKRMHVLYVIMYSM